ncbi:lysophospholipid acyltransferase family protein [Jannaschia sp. W003]|uniref:lysophospholipid acyltransferase family protein n=1 Tax=Jannaschia sp. W003 TaxID=2867012 RepID=UPI0021A5A56A|nr:lysophospholipid acyltransferase family protein [Jannaschia sp. W003]UWQ21263.1 lysophospholipid acyltransferase family protein [Jannaschia sp. W003]
MPAADADRPTLGTPGYRPYDRAALSYAATFDDPLRAGAIRAVEWMTGKRRLLALIRRFEREGVERGQAFWSHALRVMGIELRVDEAALAHIPASGPVVVVANHPHGLVDGMVLAALIGRRREDYRILTRSLLCDVPEIERFVIPVPFPHAPDAHARMMAMRARAAYQLRRGGVVALFPAGAVAAARTWRGEAVEAPWTAFTAKLVREGGATVVPVRFSGCNSRAYQVAGLVSPVLRQGLLLHEVVHALNRPQAPVIGAPIPPEAWAPEAANATRFAAWLRARCLSASA